MNNCHRMYDKFHVDNEYTTDKNYYYYECFVDDTNRFTYYITEYGKMMSEKSLLIKISKSIPKFFHKTILYFHFIPKYF